MSAFIKQENQRILWNTIQNIDLFHRVLTEAQKPLWFKEMIGLFYEKNRDRRLSRAELENLNRQVVEYMVSSLKMLYMDVTQRNAPPPSSLPPLPAQKRVSFQEDLGPVLGSYMPGASSNLDKKSIQSQQYVSEFSTRQQEYEQMMKRDTPPDVNFKEEVADDVIKNMDELLEQQRRLRELDIQDIPPPPLVPKRIQSSKATYSGRKKIVIHEENNENLSMSAPPTVDISVLELQGSTPSHPPPNTMEILEELKTEIMDMKQMLKVVFENFKERKQKT